VCLEKTGREKYVSTSGCASPFEQLGLGGLGLRSSKRGAGRREGNEIAPALWGYDAKIKNK
jgi:hypothetical protein